MHRWFILAIASVPFLITGLRTAPAAPSVAWWTTHALDKVRPDDPRPETASTAAHIFAAANEFEPFQIVLRPESRVLDDVDVDVSDLEGPGGAVVSRDNIAAYFEKYVPLAIPSSFEGAVGDWPDPLIPRVDRYAGEKRNAFPFHVDSGRNQPIWVEVYVPADTPPGSYAGEVRITIQGIKQIAVPVSLEVWNFALPSTSSLPTSFGFNGISALHQHYGGYTNDKDLFKLTYLYQKAALWHRLSIYGGSMAPPAYTIENGRMQLQWDAYDREVGPFLDGEVFSSDEPLYGARATSAELRTRRGLDTEQDKIAYWRGFANHFREKGWSDRLFNYLWDEPKADQYNALIAKGNAVHAADPGIPNLVASPLHREWSTVVDIWSPLINCFQYKNEKGFCHDMAGFEAYTDERTKGKKLWWYQSCGSHGCDVIGGDYFRGWPSYMIDNSGIANRIMQWMAWKYDIQGELYFNTDEAFGKKRDSWTDVHLFGGNGDGTLFYPGKPDKIGGTTDIPIESIRLKLIREGLEDYEYLRILDSKGGGEAVSIEVNDLIRKIYDFERDPARLYAARERIGRELSK